MENLKRLWQLEPYAKRIFDLLADLSGENYRNWTDEDFNFVQSLTWEIDKLNDKIQDYMTNLENQVTLSA